MLQFQFQVDDAVVTALVTKLPTNGTCYCPTYGPTGISGGHMFKGTKDDDVFVLERISNPGNYTRHALIIQPEEVSG